MIVIPWAQTSKSRKKSPLLRVITQNDHAHLSAKILGLWRTNGLPDHPRRQNLLRAAREHDNGWREADSAPSLRPGDSRPMDFLSASLEHRIEIWHRGVRRFVDDDPELTLLIIQHALQLHSRFFSAVGWNQAVKTWVDLRSELLNSSPTFEEELAADYRWLHLVDILSLALCSRWHRKFTLGPWRLFVDGDLLEIEPFPLAGATTFSVPCRLIADRSYSSATELATELALARWQDHRVKICPAERPLGPL